jgi:hypothetical protein
VEDKITRKPRPCSSRVVFFFFQKKKQKAFYGRDFNWWLIRSFSMFSPTTLNHNGP